MRKLYCSNYGQGPNLVLLHGWGSSSKIWRDVVAPLALKYRVWCIDLPGHDHSHAVPWDCTTEQGMQRLAEVLPPTARVLGWSLGGLWALLYARRYPRRVEGLMLVSSAPRFAAAPHWPHGMEPSSLHEFACQYTKAPAQTLKKFCALQVVNSKHAKPTLATLRGALSDAADPADALAWGLRWLEEVDLREAEGRVHRCIDLLHGEEDRVLSVDAAQDTQRIWPHVRLERIAGAGHAPFVSHAEQFLMWVDRSCSHE